MARNINGGTDRIAWNGNIPTPATVMCFAMRFKTSQATANVQLAGRWTSSSRSGFGVLLNNPANKVTFQGYDATTNRVSLASTTSVNDGNWHSLVVNISGVNGGLNGLFVDGVQEFTANSSANWPCSSANFTAVGDSYDTFWASYIGDVADVCHWDGIQLDSDEIAAYGKGVSGCKLRPSALKLYAPCVRDHQCRVGNAVVGFSGTTVSDHPKVIGSLV